MSKLKVIENSVYRVEELDGEEILTRVSSERHEEILSMYDDAKKNLESELKDIVKLEKEIEKESNKKAK